MMAQQSSQDHGKPSRLVTISIDGTPREIERGSYLVSKLKELLGVLADYELEEVKNGEFKPLQDHQHTAIQGGEVFISHVRRGGAS
jgi:hypothetical protein